MESRAVGQNLKGTHPRTILARFGLIWFSGFRGKDLNVIFYQNMPNLHNRYKSHISIELQQFTKKLFTSWSEGINPPDQVSLVSANYILIIPQNASSCLVFYKR
jgi:hypothetical protein